MTMTDVGKLGIGPTLPSFNLDVQNSGNVITRFKSSNDDVQVILDRFSKASHEAIVIFRTNGGTGHTWAMGTDNDNTDNFYIGGNMLINKYFTIMPTTGKVGIGTTNPSDKFHISGSATAIKIESGGEYVRIVPNWGDGDVFANMHSSAGQQLRFGANDQSANGHMTIDTDGDVGIGDTAPACRLDLGGGVICGESDIRFKKNIGNLTNILPKVLDLRAVSFEWKDEFNGEEGPQVGFIAQDVREIFPQTVTENSEGNLGLKQNDFTIYAIKAIQEQQTQIEELEARISALEAQQ